MNEQIHPASFRDPSGFIFYKDGLLYRQVNKVYGEDYDRLMNSGLYDKLVETGLLIPHDEVDIKYAIDENACKVIRPEVVPFISYPYEWSFSQLKDAALATIEIQKISMEFDMSLKDCSAYNIQFKKGRPLFIDTLSFEKYREGQPWVAYRQFCQHFPAPLALMSYKDVRLNQLFRIHMDGVPLDLASSLLPSRTKFKFGLLNHIHLHAKSQKYYSDKTVKKSEPKISRMAYLGLVDSLESTVKSLKWRPRGTEWGEYYEITNYSSEALDNKSDLVGKFLDEIKPESVWDLGANEGMFSRIAAGKGMQTISFDIDPVAVENNYLKCVVDNETNLLPLLLDITNPSPDIGWENKERMSVLKRGPADAVLALALIHHLAISNNLPLGKTAYFFSGICNSLIIEFVPKGDSKVDLLLATREDIFPDYTQEAFEKEFSEYFTINKSEKIADSERVLYLMEKRQ